MRPTVGSGVRDGGESGNQGHGSFCPLLWSHVGGQTSHLLTYSTPIFGTRYKFESKASQFGDSKT